MKNFIARETATGNIYRLSAKDSDYAYRLFGKEIMEMDDAFEEDFDTGNVDIDLVEITKTPKGKVLPLFDDN